MGEKKHEILTFAVFLAVGGVIFIVTTLLSPSNVRLEPSQPALTEASASAAPRDADSVNINTADIEELTALFGVGEVKARAIIDYRRENGDFRSLEELKDVPGIGEKVYSENADRIYIE